MISVDLSAVAAKLQTLASCGVVSSGRKNVPQSGPERCAYHPDGVRRTCNVTTRRLCSLQSQPPLCCAGPLICPVACCLSDVRDAFRTPALVSRGKHHHSTPTHFSGSRCLVVTPRELMRFFILGNTCASSPSLLVPYSHARTCASLHARLCDGCGRSHTRSPGNPSSSTCLSWTPQGQVLHNQTHGRWGAGFEGSRAAESPHYARDCQTTPVHGMSICSACVTGAAHPGPQ